MKNQKITCKPFMIAMFVVLNAFMSVQAMDYVSDVLKKSFIAYGSICLGVTGYLQYDAWRSDCTRECYRKVLDAIQRNDLDDLDHLFDFEGYNIHEKYFNWQTALYLAVSEKKLDVVKYLIKRGATFSKGFYSYSPLYTAVGSIDILDYFITQDPTLLEGDHGIELMAHALRCSQFNTAQYLLDKGVKFESRNRSVDEAIVSNVHNNSIKDLSCLIDEFGIAANCFTDMPNLIDYVARNDDRFNGLKLAVEHGIDPTLTDDKGNRPYDIALLNGALLNAQYLKNAQLYHKYDVVITRDHAPEFQNLEVIPNYFSMALYSGRLDELGWLYNNEEMLKQPEWLCLPNYIKNIERSIVPLSKKKLLALEKLYDLHWKLDQCKDDPKKEGCTSKYGMGVLTQIMLHRKQDNSMFSDIAIVCQK